MAAINTVRMAMTICGFDDALVVAGSTAAERIATELFSNDFATCMDKSYKDIDDDLDTFFHIAQNQGHVRALPGVVRNLKAFVQFARDEIRMGRNPATTPFPVALTPQLLRREKTHSLFVKRSESIPEAAKPAKLSTTTRWEDWEPTLINYLRMMPGRDGVPLNYVCRALDAPDPTPHPDFLDDYVAMAPLAGDAFTIDAMQVHTIIIGLIAGNDTAEAKVLVHAEEHNGRLDYIALRNHYAGIGIMALNVTKAERIIESIFYTGEKPPTMYWDKFETELTWAFNTMDKHENRIVYSDPMKVRELMKKVKADFLESTKSTINVELAKNPIVPTITYQNAITSFRNAVKDKYPIDQRNTTNRTRRQQSETNRKQQGGRGRGGTGGRKPPKTRKDSKYITLKNGKVIEYHPSFRFPYHILQQFKDADRAELDRARKEYRQQQNRSGGGSNRTTRSNNDTTAIQEMQREIHELRSMVNSSSGSSIPNDVSVGRESAISQVTLDTTGTTIMGGRTERAAMRRRPDGTRE